MSLELQVHQSIGEIDQQAWDALTGDHWPFLEHSFLHGLEQTRCVGPQSGWQPLPITVTEAGKLVGAAPLYLRMDSYGEYIFDWAWADFYHRNGVRYYPKLTVAPPFTPATGPRLLVHPQHAQPDAIRLAVAAGIQAIGAQLEVSGAHVLFCQPEEAQLLAGQGWIHRQTPQTAWENPGWPNFDAFLETLRAPARKQIRKERRELAAQGLEIRVVPGDELEPKGWQALWNFYARNVENHGSEAYLNEAFFRHLQTHLPHRVLACIAMKGNTYVGGTLSLQKGRQLFGRYWGCLEEVPFLHFECAFYRLMETCIAQGWTHFEPGAGGGHKIRRGMLPVLVESAHWLADPQLALSVRAHVAAERVAMVDHIALVREHSTLKRDDLARKLPLSDKLGDGQP